MQTEECADCGTAASAAVELQGFEIHEEQQVYSAPAHSPEMDLLLTLSVYLMLGCLGLLTSFSIVVCAFRLCLCSPAYRHRFGRGGNNSASVSPETSDQVLLVQELDRRRRLEDGFDDVDFDDEDDYDEDETDEDAEARMRKHASRTAGKTQTPSHHQWWNVLEKFFRGNDSRAEREGDGGDCGDDVDGGGGGVRGWRRMKLLHDRLTAAAAASTEATMHI